MFGYIWHVYSPYKNSEKGDKFKLQTFEKTRTKEIIDADLKSRGCVAHDFKYEFKTSDRANGEDFISLNHIDVEITKTNTENIKKSIISNLEEKSDKPYWKSCYYAD